MSAITDQIDMMQAAIDKLRALVAAPAPFYTARTDRTPQPKPTLPVLGPAGSSFTDPTFGRRILRVTDRTWGDGSYRVPSSAHLAAWNASSTAFYVMSSQGAVLPYRFDPGAFTASLLADRPYSQTEPQFSRVDPDVLYTVGGPNTRTLRRYSFSKGFANDILELDTIKAGLADPRTYVGGIISAGNPEVLVAFFGGQSQDQHTFVLYYPLHGPSWNLLDSQARLGCKLHAISVDLSGRYVLLYPANAKPYQVIVWDTETDALTPVTQNPAGHDALGYGEWVNMDQGSLAYDAAQWQFRQLSDLTATRDLIDPVLTPKEVYLADHTNWNHARPDRRVPVISGTYRFGANDTPWRAWDDEILGIATEGPSTVWRFCHHRSDVRDEHNPLGAYFEYQPMVNVSPDGKFCLFMSNWDKTLGNDPTDPGHVRTDVFVVELN